MNHIRAISEKERSVYQGHMDRTFSYIREGERKLQCMTTDRDAAHQIHQISKVMDDIVSNAEILFSVRTQGRTAFVSSNGMGDAFVRICRYPICVLKQHYPLHRLNPLVDLFFKKAEGHHLSDIVSERSISAEVSQRQATKLNEVVEEIRKEAGSRKFRNHLANHLRRSNKNYAELVDYINALFDAHARWLVIRLDLAYEAEFAKDIGYDDAKGHLKALLKYFRTKFRCKTGYAWKLEYGFVKGIHFHVLLFIDGDAHQQEISIAKQIGLYWENQITDKRGMYWNCNARKADFKDTVGIGKIHHSDGELRKWLNEKVALYITKPDQYSRMRVPDGDRIFGKGKTPVMKSNRGRPRQDDGV